jgi:hypothetical protein
MNPVQPGPAHALQIGTDVFRSAALSVSDKAIIYDIRCGALAPAG